jgi:predicted nucleic acid-binding protein
LSVPLHYWDSCTFIGYFNDEKDKIDGCISVLEDAQAKKLKIITSSLTLVEVIRIKGKPIPPKEQEDLMMKFFRANSDWIIFIDAERKVMEIARNLIRDFGLKSYDAVHAATAIRAKANFIDTFDPDLLKLSNKIGDPPIIVQHPPVRRQLRLL